MENLKSKKMSSGITLIALVVTIIVLLILAGISITMLTGDNGILNRAGEAKNITEEKQIIEEAKMDIMSTQASKLTGKINEKELKTILFKYGTLSTEEKIIDKKLTTTDGKYIIPISKIYNDNIVEATIENTDSKNYYGDLIDYDVDIGVSLDDKDQYDWKIFYNDGTNIYIIAEDYVRMDNSLMPEIPGRIENSSEPYCLKWSYNSGNIQNEKDGSADIFGASAPSKTISFANKFLTVWKPYVTGNNSASENSNAKMVATLLDTDLWSYNSSTKKGFTNSAIVNSYSTKSDELFAIGGPTLEMWVKSWNEKYPDDKLYYDRANETGYYVKAGSSPTEDSNINIGSSIMQSKTGYGEVLYFPHPLVNNSRDTFTTSNKCWAYWLSTPSGSESYNIMAVCYDGSVSSSFFSSSLFGIRPVVCLPSDITATWNETDEVWNITNK